jgi:4-amino-4-deoxy-L-arabinose transferase-like glycosyltransferase
MLWCFCPNVLGYGHIVTGDLPCTALGILAAYAVWQWLVEERSSGAIIAGVAVGMALLAKMVWLVWFGLLPLMWLVWTVGRRQGVAQAGREWRTVAAADDRRRRLRQSRLCI